LLIVVQRAIQIHRNQFIFHIRFLPHYPMMTSYQSKAVPSSGLCLRRKYAILGAFEQDTG
ncbi:MAG: hypothetical protein IJA26_07245, partial [Clostridia bacterium]|nr:hypothetical protein [Clostridia bacterium]